MIWYFVFHYFCLSEASFFSEIYFASLTAILDSTSSGSHFSSCTAFLLLHQSQHFNNCLFEPYRERNKSILHLKNHPVPRRWNCLWNLLPRYCSIKKHCCLLGFYWAEGIGNIWYIRAHWLPVRFNAIFIMVTVGMTLTSWASTSCIGETLWLNSANTWLAI